ncbi:MAG TPA: lysophospholipid acyltransferase family protein [Rhodocyclaceae bacterium]|nr:lysophospholipid acyltransferase family protein [Rhodocyclaceae bacterium]
MSRLVLHVLRGIAIVWLLFPRVSRLHRNEFKQTWSRQLVGLLGIRMANMPITLPGASLIVSNHISWLDIFVINALTQTHFVCKDDVRKWPILGWLVKNTDTVFIERGNRTAAAHTARALCDQLDSGERVTVFPEGTTSNGTTLLPFHAALLQAATQCNAPVVPLALSYVNEHGIRSMAPAYDGDITLWQCLRAICLAQGIHVEVKVLPSIASDIGRRKIAGEAYQQIATALGMPDLLAASRK